MAAYRSSTAPLAFAPNQGHFNPESQNWQAARGAYGPLGKRREGRKGSQASRTRRVG